MKAYDVISFLEQLKINNNREWFQKNRKQYDEAKAEILSFTSSLIPVIAEFDESVRFVGAKDCLFRIFRDVRFSKDKSPYKINMGVWITHNGRKSSGPGYYIHIQPGESFLSGGVYMPDPVQLKKIRQEIFYNADEFKSILKNTDVVKLAGGLSTLRKQNCRHSGFPKDFKDIDLIKYRHYLLSAGLDNKMIRSDQFFEYVVEVFKAFSPLNAFLKRALES